jgi:hypothetical protein
MLDVALALEPIGSDAIVIYNLSYDEGYVKLLNMSKHDDLPS